MSLPATYTTAQIAEHLGTTTRNVRAKAAQLGLGINLGGPAGYRYTDADVAALLESMRPAPVPARRRRRRRAAAP